MSLVSMADIGVSRDLVAPGERIAHNVGTSGARSPAGYASLMAAQIPSEALLAYTTVIAVFPPGRYDIARWIVWILAVATSATAVVVGYIGQRRTIRAATGSTEPPRRWNLPYLPATAAAGAMAIYGMVIPGSGLQAAMTSDGFQIAGPALAVGGGVLMSLLTPFLGSGNRVEEK